jgi:uncharacterized protein (TIGR00369 family)
MQDFVKRLEASARGTFWELLGCRLVSVDKKQATVTLEVEDRHLNGNGIMHGGVHASLLDNTMGILAMAARGSTDVVTTNLNIHYVAPLKRGTVTVTAELIHQSGKIITVRGVVSDAAGRLGSYGSASFRVLS